MNKQLHRDVWVGTVLLAFCAVVFVLATQISGEAAYLPVALSVLMALCASAVVYNGLRKSKNHEGKFTYSMTVRNSKNAFIFMGFIFAYYFVFRYITYWLATPIFMLFAQKYLKVKSWKVNILITVIYMVVCYVLFVIVLKLPIYKVGILGRYFRYV